MLYIDWVNLYVLFIRLVQLLANKRNFCIFFFWEMCANYATGTFSRIVKPVDSRAESQLLYAFDRCDQSQKNGANNKFRIKSLSLKMRKLKIAKNPCAL